MTNRIFTYMKGSSSACLDRSYRCWERCHSLSEVRLSFEPFPRFESTQLGLVKFYFALLLNLQI